MPQRKALKLRIIKIHEASRGSAGARITSAQLKVEGAILDHYNIRTWRRLYQLNIKDKC